MDNAFFIDSFRELNGRFLKLVDSLSALRALSSIRLQGQSDGELLESVLEVLMQNQDLERCSVYMLEGGQLVNRAGLDWNDLIGTARRQGPVSQNLSFALGQGVVGRTAQTGQLQHCRDCASDHRFLNPSNLGTGPDDVDEARQPSRRPMAGALISVPVTNGEEVLGVLNVSHPHAHFFTETHERLLTMFGNFLGQLLVNNRLLHRMERLVDERTRELETALAEAHRLKQRYEELSVVDELTGLYNRRFFFPEARAALARAVRQEQPYCVLIIDIDHFKRINDTLGHSRGDDVLRAVAELMHSQLREGDILARFGGEEFVIAAPETDLDGAAALAERIRNEMRAVAARFDLDYPTSLSIGVSCLDEAGGRDTQSLIESLIHEADQALYYGKHNGRDQTCRYPDIACRI